MGVLYNPISILLAGLMESIGDDNGMDERVNEHDNGNNCCWHPIVR
jgi:hypothetical protein